MPPTAGPAIRARLRPSSRAALLAQYVHRHEVRDDGVIRGPEERVGGSQRDRRCVDMFDPQLSGRRKQGDDPNDTATDKVARNDERAARQAIRDGSSEQEERNARRDLDADGDPELKWRRTEGEEL